MSACVFETIPGDSHYTHLCTVCGRKVLSPRERIVRECGGGTGLLAKATSYSVAYLRWTAAGRPHRTTEEQASTLAICQSCEHFDADKCGLCGCWLRQKIKMATENCPIQKW